MTDIVNGLLLQNNHVLMGFRSPARRNSPNVWSFPGGHVEAGEKLEAALLRELKEETGIQAEAFAKITEFRTQADDPQDAIVFHLFTVTQWQGETENLGDEHTELRWVGFEEAVSLPDLAFPEYREVFDVLRERGEL
ncbi:CTP pyrophosphohydrolase [Pseudovibrio sp. Ad13]|uniref:NUDIX domain-containing protein n=1 Tax=Pseudovibrio sp. Ad13 TaxID=989396 RepID=UPI0007AEC48D|nr:NUDIX domain-containing protein [Pseudovibrio sp. Ad13]KZK76107.1 CTP pyrophosphohydrolase [Pseudovibrio sp. Ad13]